MPGVVHEHIHPPVGLGRGGDERVGLLFYGHVGGHGQGFHAELFGDLGGYRLGGGQARSEELFTTTSCQQPPARGPRLRPMPPGGAGHYGAAAVF